MTSVTDRAPNTPPNTTTPGVPARRPGIIDRSPLRPRRRPQEAGLDVRPEALRQPHHRPPSPRRRVESLRSVKAPLPAEARSRTRPWRRLDRTSRHEVEAAADPRAFYTDSAGPSSTLELVDDREDVAREWMIR